MISTLICYISLGCPLDFSITNILCFLDWAKFTTAIAMPTTKTHGSPSAANGAIGGVPTIHYFDYHSRGRGQVIRLLWEDAGIAYEDIRYSFEEYPEYKKTRIAKMSPFAAVLVVELNGRILTQSYAILRHFARQLDAYEGETEEAKYWADAMCDIVIDCMCNSSCSYCPTYLLKRSSANDVYCRLLLPRSGEDVP